ncbi:hypothetical protein ACFYWN_38890 [Streptomyces sp. NPDC002917]|uniref:hypothetical protein n=1 Tax=unclassified Streptomyces TaxID=2593676 RepID=UPI0033BD0F2D|nr:hypothetical protein OHB03_42020 [Streptomyces sp. NBC_01643]WTF25647.1 hypothetical protein OG955_05040 [Streptomyces sp. NBC_01602]
MSGDSYYFGESVTMHGGQNNTGIDKRQAAPADVVAVPPELQAAIEEMLQLVEELRNQVPGASAQVLDESLPSIRTDGSVQSQERHRALMAVAGIAATVGAVGQPVAEAVNRILQLMGVR